ncbi:zinc-binding dehydrogenase [Sciscionella marina]|uniref:quinone oxidoreductase family protein n=1 Tax=Sciscionella marina TaxID=508770 RepID=UPI00036C5161
MTANVTNAIRVHETGGPEVLRLDEVTREAGAGQLLVRVEAAGVNFIDTYQRSGVYSVELPHALGLEGAGTVEAVGDEASDFTPGDRVAWVWAAGSYAEHTVVPVERAVRIPDDVDTKTAGALMLQGLTAHYLLRSTYRVDETDTVLVHAAAGGVGLLLVQLAKSLGARVIATASTAEKRALATGAGADEVLGYEGFDTKLRELTGGIGVSVVYDGVGKDTFDASLASIRPRGYLVLFGGSSGQVPPFDLQRLNAAGSLFVTRPSLGPYIADRTEYEWRVGELFEAVGNGSLNVRIGGSYPLAEAANAHRDLEGRKTTGKLLLVP